MMKNPKTDTDSTMNPKLERYRRYQRRKKGRKINPNQAEQEWDFEIRRK